MRLQPALEVRHVRIRQRVGLHIGGDERAAEQHQVPVGVGGNRRGGAVRLRQTRTAEDDVGDADALQSRP